MGVILKQDVDLSKVSKKSVVVVFKEYPVR